MTDIKTRYLAAKRKLFDKYYATRLNSPQREAVFTVNGPLLVLAGAGSGKTTVLVQRIAFIIKYGDAYFGNTMPSTVTEEQIIALERAVQSASGEELENMLSSFASSPCPPWAVLAITFTNKAANEMKERLSASFEDESISSSIWAGTFHSICVRILRKFTAEAGYKPNFSIYDTDDKKRLVSECMKKLNIDEKMLPVKSVMSAISVAKDKLIPPQDYEIGKDFREKHIAEIYAEYQARLEAANALDFDDIIMKTVFLLEGCDEAREYYTNRFKYVCVDEYQDTNYAQFRLTELLSSKYRNIMVVGDDDQSIYKFRGATVENILSFDSTYPEAKVIKLEQNYRSTKNILAAANAVIANNKLRHGKKLWCASDAGERMTVRELPTQNDESRYIIDRILDLVIKEKMRYRDMAILYRVNELSRSVESAFAKSGIPYRVIGGQRFYDRKEIRDMLAYLHVVFNPSDDQRLKRIINEPKRKIGASTVDAIAEIAAQSGVSMYDVMRNSQNVPALAKSSQRLVEFVAMMDAIREKFEKPSDILNELFEKTGYHDMLRAEGEISLSRIDSVNEFITAALEYEAKADEPTLAGFLEDVALVSDVDKYDENADAVVLMTVHSSKGLEFPVVFLAGMEDGIFPSAQNLYSETELAEERRLAYVAITRAKKRIFVTHVHERMMYGRTMYNKLSVFIRDEIPDDLKFEERAYVKGRDNSPAGAKKPRMQMSGEFMRRADSSHSTVAPRPAQAQSKPSGYGLVRFDAGTRVMHSLFGMGTIVSVKEMGGDLLYEVNFDSGATKKLMATFAKLTKI